MFIEYVVFGVIVVVIIGVITLVYHKAPFRYLPSNKPKFTWFPKYQVIIQLPDWLQTTEALVTQLAELGFTLKTHDKTKLHFTRGCVLGDFSIKLTKINLHVELPLNDNPHFQLNAAWVVAFDTGDFWTFLTELKQLLEE